jgi:predicted ribosomally synthesized peptide with SipW-like signal peptide
MRKSIVLAIVVVVALVVAGTSGVFATWSDSEVSEFNYIETGSLDLKVNGADDAPWGRGVPTKVFLDCMVPLKLYGPFEVELWNAGQCEFPSEAFIHFKDYECFNAPPKINPYDPEVPDSRGSLCWYENYGPQATTGYPDPTTGLPWSGALKPEPELVAEYGGKVDCTEVPGIGGAMGDNCSMAAGVQVIVTDEAGTILIGPALMQDLYCSEIPLFLLWPCEARTIYLWFSLYQYSEEDFDFNFFLHPSEFDPPLEPGTPEYEAALHHWMKFNDWPSWAYMKDAISFSMEFDVLLRDP